MAAPEPIPYYPPQAPIDPHMRTSNGLLAAAAAILERPDAEIDGELRAQACEKLWGAAARRLQVFADARGWYYCEHSVASRLVVQIGEALDADSSELIANFDSAGTAAPQGVLRGHHGSDRDSPPDAERSLPVCDAGRGASQVAARSGAARQQALPPGGATLRRASPPAGGGFRGLRGAHSYSARAARMARLRPLTLGSRAKRRR